MNQYRTANDPDGIVDGIIGQRKLIGHLANWKFQFEQFEQGEPLNTGQPAMINPSPGEVVKAVFTPGAAK